MYRLGSDICVFLFEVGNTNQINTLRSGQNGRYFTDDIFIYIFLNENAWILIRISLNFIPKCRIINIPALVQIIAWRHPGDKPLSEPMMVRLLTSICVTQPQCVKAACGQLAVCINGSVDHTLVGAVGLFPMREQTLISIV